MEKRAFRRHAVLPSTASQFDVRLLPHTVVTLAPLGLAHHRLNSTVPLGDLLVGAEGQRKWQVVATHHPPRLHISRRAFRMAHLTNGFLAVG